MGVYYVMLLSAIHIMWFVYMYRNKEHQTDLLLPDTVKVLSPNTSA